VILLVTVKDVTSSHALPVLSRPSLREADAPHMWLNLH
jgi:hypothetical protein